MPLSSMAVHGRIDPNALGVIIDAFDEPDPLDLVKKSLKAIGLPDVKNATVQALVKQASNDLGLPFTPPFTGAIVVRAIESVGATNADMLKSFSPYNVLIRELYAKATEKRSSKSRGVAKEKMKHILAALYKPQIIPWLLSEWKTRHYQATSASAKNAKMLAKMKPEIAAMISCIKTSQPEASADKKILKTIGYSQEYGVLYDGEADEAKTVLLSLHGLYSWSCDITDPTLEGYRPHGPYESLDLFLRPVIMDFVDLMEWARQNKIEPRIELLWR